MGDSVYELKAAEEMCVEPTGNLLANGWMAGTFVKYSSSPVTFSKAITSVERTDGTGVIAGYLLYGSQHNRPVEMKSDMWTTDKRQRAGGDNHYDWTAIDASRAIEFDNNGLVQRLGSRVCTLVLLQNGIHKFYVFETKNKAERHVPGSGITFTYQPNDILYASENGLLTKEQETLGHVRIGFVVASVGTDVEGDFLIVTTAAI